MTVALVAFVTPNNVYAQWSFRESIHISGRCDGVDQAIINAINGQIPEISGFATRAECEAARAYINSIRSSYGGCTAYASASPCVGHDIGGGSVAGIANPTVGAYTQGSSFFYTSVPEEVKNWQAEQDRIDALIGNRDISPSTGLSNTTDGSYNSSLNQDMAYHAFGSSSGVNIGNGVFTGIPTTPLQPVGQNVDMAKVLSYIGQLDDVFYSHLLNNPSEIYSLLPNKYKELTGYDIDVIVNKNPSSRTAEEQKILENYNAFVQETCSEVDKYAIRRLAEIDAKPEKKEIDMAVLAKVCYTDDDGADIMLTNYRSVGPNDFLDNTEVKNLAEVIQQCNSIGESYGFHCELYQNSITGELSIACEGSGGFVSQWQDWVLNNFANGAGLEVPQFNTIDAIATAINSMRGDNPSITITGHSLGGALASYLGLKTGLDTYTFNAEGLNPGVISSIPNYDDSKILAYHSSYEALTNSQKAMNATLPALQGVGTNGVGVPTGGSQTYVLKVPGKEINLNNRTLSDMVTSPVGHSMDIIVNHFLDTNHSVQSNWSNVGAYRREINKASNDSLLYRHDSLIIFAQ